MIYSTYASEFCKEDINTLKYGMTLSDLLELNEYTQVMESYKAESYENAEKEAKSKRR